MGQEADIGGLKADMKTVKAQTSAIFDKLGEMSDKFADHHTAEQTRLGIIEDRQGTLREHIKETVDPAVKDFKATKHKTIGYLLGFGAGGAGIVELIKTLFKGSV